MNHRDLVRPGMLRRRGLRLVTVTLLGAVLLGVTAYAASSRPQKVARCGFANATYGKSGLYPWHMSCGAAREVVTASGNPHAHVIDFGPGWDGGAVRINGRYWVCTGQMGFYNCGYPYRPRKVAGEKGYEGPFTEDVEYRTCSEVVPPATACPKSVEFSQPPS
jgi:hypothetical protein